MAGLTPVVEGIDFAASPRPGSPGPSPSSVPIREDHDDFAFGAPLAPPNDHYVSHYGNAPPPLNPGGVSAEHRVDELDLRPFSPVDVSAPALEETVRTVSLVAKERLAHAFRALEEVDLKGKQTGIVAKHGHLSHFGGEFHERVVPPVDKDGDSTSVREFLYEGVNASHQKLQDNSKAMASLVKRDVRLLNQTDAEELLTVAQKTKEAFQTKAGKSNWFLRSFARLGLGSDKLVTVMTQLSSVKKMEQALQERVNQWHALQKPADIATLDLTSATHRLAEENMRYEFFGGKNQALFDKLNAKVAKHTAQLAAANAKIERAKALTGTPVQEAEAHMLALPPLYKEHAELLQELQTAKKAIEEDITQIHNLQLQLFSAGSQKEAQQLTDEIAKVRERVTEAQQTMETRAGVLDTVQGKIAKARQALFEFEKTLPGAILPNTQFERLRYSPELLQSEQDLAAMHDDFAAIQERIIIFTEKAASRFNDSFLGSDGSLSVTQLVTTSAAAFANLMAYTQNPDTAIDDDLKFGALQGDTVDHQALSHAYYHNGREVVLARLAANTEAAKKVLEKHDKKIKEIEAHLLIARNGLQAPVIQEPDGSVDLAGLRQIREGFIRQTQELTAKLKEATQLRTVHAQRVRDAEFRERQFQAAARKQRDQETTLWQARVKKAAKETSKMGSELLAVRKELRAVRGELAELRARPHPYAPLVPPPEPINPAPLAPPIEMMERYVADEHDDDAGFGAPHPGSRAMEPNRPGGDDGDNPVRVAF